MLLLHVRSEESRPFRFMAGDFATKHFLAFLIESNPQSRQVLHIRTQSFVFLASCDLYFNYDRPRSLASADEGERPGDWLCIGSEFVYKCFLIESLWFTGAVSELSWLLAVRIVRSLQELWKWRWWSNGPVIRRCVEKVTWWSFYTFNLRVFSAGDPVFMVVWREFGVGCAFLP